MLKYLLDAREVSAWVSEWEEQLREPGCPEGFLAPGCQGSFNSPTHSLKKKKKLFTYLFLAVMGLHRCVRAFSGCGKRVLFVAVLGLLIAVASLVAGHMGSRAHGLSGTWAQLQLPSSRALAQ